MLIDLGGAAEGDVDMAVGGEEGDQRQQAADDEGYIALDVEVSNPTHTEPWPLKPYFTSTCQCARARWASAPGLRVARAPPRRSQPDGVDHRGQQGDGHGSRHQSIGFGTKQGVESTKPTEAVF